jgi:hypothetical protein
LEIDVTPDFSSEEAAHLFGKAFSAAPGWSFVAHQEYRAASGKHYCSVFIHHRKKRPPTETASLHAHVSFGVGSSGMMAGKKIKFDPSLDFLNSHPELLHGRSVDVSAVYIYKVSRYDSLLKLPIQYPLAGFDRSDIIGVRLSVREKSSEGRPQFTIVLDSAAEGNIYHRVGFSYKISDVEKFLPILIVTSSAMSRKLVAERQASSE